MDDKAHTILSGVIASHGEQLTTSTAFCKVYLTGYLADYPNEKALLIALKDLELPATLSAYVKAEITEAALFDCVNQLSASWEGTPDDLAWGVDAWAAAIGISGAMRCKVREQCFPIMPMPKPIVIEVPVPVAARKSRLGFGARLMTNVAGVFGLMMLQVFGSSSPSSSVVPPMPFVLQAVATIPPIEKPSLPKVERSDFFLAGVTTEQTSPLTAIDIPLLDSSIEIVELAQPVVVQIDKPKPISLGVISSPLSPKDYEIKSQRLLAETESFLKYGN
jgi:hypothetical protein